MTSRSDVSQQLSVERSRCSEQTPAGSSSASVGSFLRFHRTFRTSTSWTKLGARRSHVPAGQRYSSTSSSPRSEGRTTRGD